MANGERHGFKYKRCCGVGKIKRRRWGSDAVLADEVRVWLGRWRWWKNNSIHQITETESRWSTMTICKEFRSMGSMGWRGYRLLPYFSNFHMKWAGFTLYARFSTVSKLFWANDFIRANKRVPLSLFLRARDLIKDASHIRMHSTYDVLQQQQ